LWHGRSHTTKLQRAGERQAEGADFDAVTRQSTIRAHAEGSLPEPIDGDFPAYGKAYRDLAEDEYAEATAIAVERLRAFNWLSGASSDWDNVPTQSL